MSRWSSRGVSVQGVTLRVYRTGGNKPPVVAAHGFADNGLFWTSVAQALEAQYEVIMYDARGHGLSPMPAEGIPAEAHVEDLANLVRALGLDRPVLMGHSMGAGTVAGVAAKYPDLTRAIILEDPGWRNEATAQPGAPAVNFRARALAEAQRYRTMSREEVMADCRAKHPLWPEAQVGPWADSRFQLDMRIFDTIGGPRPPWQDMARAIACPALLITADPERGSIVTPEVAAEAATLLRHGQVLRLPGAGHAIRSDQLDAFVAAVSAFLAQVYGR